MDAASSGAHCRTIASAAAASGSSLSYFTVNAYLRGARSQTSAGAAMGSESYSYAIGAATLSFPS
jgi:uncharacterized protein (DUF1778 family)